MVKADASFQCELKVLRMQEGFATNDSSELLRSVLRASGNEADTVAFGTEAPWLNKLGAEAVVFGPGSMLSAHSPARVCAEERVSPLRGDTDRRYSGTMRLERPLKAKVQLALCAKLVAVGGFLEKSARRTMRLALQ